MTRKEEEMKKTVLGGIYAILIAVVLIVTSGKTVCADNDIGIEPGQNMPDFSVSLTDGSTFRLSETLKEKDLVVFNIFASWCNPCEKEFPEMEKVYQENKDRMELISLSFEPKDTMEIISEYKENHGLTFPMGLINSDLSFLHIQNVPTTIFIDKKGMIGFIKVGAFMSREEFEEKVNIFLSSDYNGKPIASEKAVKLFPYLLLYIVVSSILLVIGRWGIFKKAGKKGWHSLIPILNIYKEYSVCWKGWVGLVYILCLFLIMCSNFVANKLGLPGVTSYILVVAASLLSLLQSLKLAKAFGKNKVWGVLMIIPGFKEICRMILAVSKAKYKYPEER